MTFVDAVRQGTPTSSCVPKDHPMINLTQLPPTGTCTRQRLNHRDHHNRCLHRHQHQALRTTVFPPISHLPYFLRVSKLAYHRLSLPQVLFCVTYLPLFTLLTYHRLSLLMVLFCLLYLPLDIILAYHRLLLLLVLVCLP